MRLRTPDYFILLTNLIVSIYVYILKFYILFFRLKLQKFVKFSDTTEALKGNMWYQSSRVLALQPIFFFYVLAATSLVEGKVSKKLNKLLKKLFVKEVQDEALAVADSKLAASIKVKVRFILSHDVWSNTNLTETKFKKTGLMLVNWSDIASSVLEICISLITFHSNTNVKRCHNCSCT